MVLQPPSYFFFVNSFLCRFSTFSVFTAFAPLRPPASPPSLLRDDDAVSLVCMRLQAPTIKSLFTESFLASFPVIVPFLSLEPKLYHHALSNVYFNRRPRDFFFYPVAHDVSIPPSSSHFIMHLRRGVVSKTLVESQLQRLRGSFFYARKRRRYYWTRKGQDS